MSSISPLRIDVPGVGAVSAAVHAAHGSRDGARERSPDGARPGGAVVLACGAGTSMEHPFLVTVAEGLAARGLTVMRFNFPYREQGSARPDPTPKLVATYRAAAGALRSSCPGKKLVLAGKSMGGRMASLLAAEGYTSDGLVFLGYPLHPAGKPQQMRDAHLPEVRSPMLFVQGTRDALCDLSLLRPVLARVGALATLHEVRGADHGFAVRKMDGRTGESVLAEVIDTSAAWIEALP